ncbi:hypothetical protein CEXT_171181 [Caerostris extrusa]|uniref:Uncharacterized protein n=1 Tax=Caerostris extrusa TaxID=172846 RepID=A0AAV4YF53_CAEEX|nr:hypothetical protein CEXT_171181 [Caerostris extrusa]
MTNYKKLFPTDPNYRSSIRVYLPSRNEKMAAKRHSGVFLQQTAFPDSFKHPRPAIELKLSLSHLTNQKRELFGNKCIPPKRND